MRNITKNILTVNMKIRNILFLCNMYNSYNLWVVFLALIDNIISMLKLKGITQVDFAKALSDKGVTKQTITDWKRGKSNTYYLLLTDISNFLGVSADSLLETKKDAPEGASDGDITPDEFAVLVSKLSDEGRRQLIEYARFVQFRETSQ